MTQMTLDDYNDKLKELIKEQREKVKVYNRQQTKKSKRKVMDQIIIPLEHKIEKLKQ